MISVDLEKELLRQNKRLATPEQLLMIKELDKVGSLDFNWSQIGFNHIAAGKLVSREKSRRKDEASKFDQSRVFHVSQIESLAKKYFLRFLPGHYYAGSVDEKLPYKIGIFEALHGVKSDKYNSFILAPKSAFKLESNPKDPLFFYKINEEYYYLVHKWGNDLSILNRMKGFLSRFNEFNILFLNPFSIAMSFLFIMLWFCIGYSDKSIGLSVLLILSLTNILLAFLTSFGNEWNSPFKDE